MLIIGLCAAPSYVPFRQVKRSDIRGRTFKGPHNVHSELSHFMSSSSFCHLPFGRDVFFRKSYGR